jgi:hypothetical protein
VDVSYGSCNIEYNEGTLECVLDFAPEYTEILGMTIKIATPQQEKLMNTYKTPSTSYSRPMQPSGSTRFAEPDNINPITNHKSHPPEAQRKLE